VSPSFARFDPANAILQNAILIRNDALESGVGPNSADLRLRKFRGRVGFAKLVCSVALFIVNICFMSVPAQVCKNIIDWVSVVMTPLHSIRNWANKRGQNQCMDPKILWPIFFPEKNEGVRPVLGIFTNSRLFQPSGSRSNSAVIRNFVKSLKTNNGKPSFHGGHICTRYIPLSNMVTT